MKDRPPELISAMLEPGFHSGQARAAELRETHISWVVLIRDRAYKVKKPLVLPFLDYGTLERRHEMCRAEIRLNRRLAPAIYLRVVAIVRRDGGYALAPETADDAVEYAVEMNRIEADRTLAALIQRGGLETVHVRAVARLLARFHREAAVASRDVRGTERLIAALEENLATLREIGGGAVSEAGLESAEHYTARFLTTHRKALEAREGDDLVRDCHGDLRAEHVVVPEDERPYVFDCIEFDPSLRQIDVASDLAFLYMDLVRLGATEPAERLVADYRAAGGDPGDDQLLAFFASYRAWVRAKVSCVRAAELAGDDPGRADAVVEAGDLFALGERFAWRSRRPLVLVVCGVAASGKTTLAAALSARAGLPHLSSDVVRKRLAGLDPTEHAARRHYSPDFTDRTYRELGRCARKALDEQGGVIVDATFHLRARREAFRSTLGGHDAPVLFAVCRAPAPVLIERARRRKSGPTTSDADESVLAAQLERWEPLDEVPARDRTELWTQAPVETQLRATEAFVDDRAWDEPGPRSEHGRESAADQG